MTPRCATPEQYAAWPKLARLTKRAKFCHDCTPGYQARMKIAGRCDHPEVKFDDEGGYTRKDRHG